MFIRILYFPKLWPLKLQRDYTSLENLYYSNFFINKIMTSFLFSDINFHSNTFRFRLLFQTLFHTRSLISKKIHSSIHWPKTTTHPSPSRFEPFLFTCGLLIWLASLRRSSGLIFNSSRWRFFFPTASLTGNRTRRPPGGAVGGWVVGGGWLGVRSVIAIHQPRLRPVA